MKICRRCKKTKPRNEFYNDAHKKDGVHTQCKQCHAEKRLLRRQSDPKWVELDRERSKQWRKNNPEKSKRSVRNATIRAKYGITGKEYDELLLGQGGRCAICHRTDSGIGHKNLHVDHCHTTGVVRGLLCQPCNTGLGKFSDSIDLLRNAVDYLARRT